MQQSYIVTLPRRTRTQLSASFLQAPFNHAAVAFMSIVGVPTLMAWNRDIAQVRTTDYLELPCLCTL